jgi:peptidoglycan/xylan/chitin deacetylase (PgdA/CDA1 family)
MKKSVQPAAVIAFLTFGASAVLAQSIAPPYEVASWQGFRTAAVSFTFDDNTSNQFAVAAPMFDEFAYHMTFFTVTGSGPATDWFHANWDGLAAAAARGHEVASHGVTHTSFSGMKDSLQTVESRDSRDTIEARIPGYRCVTIAYPYCTIGRKSIIQQYYIAARNCSGVVEARTPPDFMSISSIVCGTQGMRTTKDFRSRTASAVKSKGWVVLLFHGVDNDGGWSPIVSDTLRKMLEYLKANDGQFWVPSFGEAARYIRERNAVSVAETSSGDAGLTMQVTDTLDNAIYDEPITLRRPLPQGWPSATVSQNGHAVDSKITEENATVYVQFDALPDGGDVVITRRELDGMPGRDGRAVLSPKLWQNYPNPFNPETVIRFETAGTGPVTLRVYDTLGREVAVLLNANLQPGPHSAVFRAAGLESGMYVCRLSGGGFVLHRKMMLLR